MSAGVYRKQYQALAAIAENSGISFTTPEGSFNQKFCALCAVMVDELGETFVPITGGGFTARKADYLRQVALALGASTAEAATSFRETFLKAAHAIWSKRGGTIVPDYSSSYDWRVYQYLIDATGLVPAAQDELTWWGASEPSLIDPNTAVDKVGDLDPVKYVDNPCLEFTGAETLAVPGLVGTETITLEAGSTSTPTAGAGSISFTAGLCYGIYIDGVLTYTCAENSGTTVYDITGSGNHATLSTDTVRATDDDAPAWFIRDGGGISGAVFIPALSDGTTDALGNALTCEPQTQQNGSPSKHMATDYGMVPTLVTPWGDAAQGAEVNGKPSYAVSTYTISNTGAAWETNESGTGETWTAPDSTFPPTTGWSVGSLGSAAPTMGYDGSPWVSEGVYGDELVVNGGFDTDTDWTKDAGWTIGGGSANATAATGGVYQNIGDMSGKTVLVTFDITSYTSGSVKPFFYGTVTVGTNVSGIGSYSEEITVNAGHNSNFGIDGDAAFTGSIDNVSAREVIETPYEFRRISYADLSVHPNGGGATWLQWDKRGEDDRCHLIEIAAYDNGREFTPAEYSQNVQWAGDSGCGTPPLEVVTDEGEPVTYEGEVVLN